MSQMYTTTLLEQAADMIVYIVENGCVNMSSVRTFRGVFMT